MVSLTLNNVLNEINNSFRLQNSKASLIVASSKETQKLMNEIINMLALQFPPPTMRSDQNVKCLLSRMLLETITNHRHFSQF